MPGWVQQGVEEYARRIRGELGFEIIEIPLARRTRSANIDQCIQKESEALLARLTAADYVVALEVKGKPLDTAGLAQRLEHIQTSARPLNLLIGGPDGLSEACRQRADECWSLSGLTLPHPLVRILLTEQLYRAHSLLKGHPYHRE